MVRLQLYRHLRDERQWALRMVLTHKGQNYTWAGPLPPDPDIANVRETAREAMRDVREFRRRMH